MGFCVLFGYNVFLALTVFVLCMHIIANYKISAQFLLVDAFTITHYDD